MQGAPDILLINVFSFVLGALSVLGFGPFHFFFVPILSASLLLLIFNSCKNYLRAAVAGLSFGIGLFITGISWIFISLHKFGNMNLYLASLVVLIFALYLALYPALLGVFFHFFRNKSLSIRFLAIFPALWTISELARGYVFTGFPWLTFGYSQLPGSTLHNLAPILGVYGVSFFTILVSGILAFLVLQIKKRNLKKNIPTLLGLAFFIFVSCESSKRFEWSSEIKDSALTFALLQGNVSQTDKWKAKNAAAILSHYIKLINESSAKIILLPETAFPMFQTNLPSGFLDDLEASLKKRGVNVLMGIPEFVKEGEFYNSVISLGESPTQTYRKMHLVPFGDYFPFENFFSWFSESVEIPMSSFSNGEKNQLPIEIANQSIAINICYEDAFGRVISRQLPKATLLANFTNDAWWGKSIAAKQHLQIAQMRAAETARPMLRSTNTGMTAVIDWRGRIKAEAIPFKTQILEGSIKGRTGLTPYARLGNYSVFLLSFSILLACSGFRDSIDLA